MHRQTSENNKDARKPTHQSEGFIALMSVIILGALVLSVSIGLSLRSIGESNMSLDAELSTRARFLANACAEYALLELKNNLNYSGGETIIVDGSDSCDILPLEGIGNLNRTVMVESIFQNYRRKIQIDIAQVNPINIVSWQDVPHF